MRGSVILERCCRCAHAGKMRLLGQGANLGALGGDGGILQRHVRGVWRRDAGGRPTEPTK
eukprot:273832-Alexandrium_andersonii.AAC.1